MDINLPKLSGIDATKRIKTHAPNAVVIGLSVQHSAQTFHAVLEAGAAALLSKEQATVDLYRTITHFLKVSIEIRTMRTFLGRFPPRYG